MDTRMRAAAGLLVAAVALLFAAWWLMGDAGAPEEDKPRQGVGRVAKRVEMPPVRRDVEKSAHAEAAKLPEEGTDIKVTKTCKYIVEWQQRNVPDFVILDNLQARSQRFEEKDLACLTASGVSPGILRYAEHSPKTPKLKEGDKVGVQ